MRWVFYVLVAANLGFCAWQIVTRDPGGEIRQVAEAPLPEGAVRLTLLSEVAGSGGNAPAGANCFSVGPLNGVEQVDAVRGWLRERGATATLRDGSRPEAAFLDAQIPADKPFQEQAFSKAFQSVKIASTACQ